MTDPDPDPDPDTPPPRGASKQPRRPLPDNPLGLELDWMVEMPVHDVAVRLQVRATHDAATATYVEQLYGELVNLLDRHGPDHGAQLFLDVPLQQRRDRQAAAVTVAVLANLRVADRDGHLPPERTARLLSPVEDAAVRLCATVSPIRAVTVALSQQGAAPGQLTGPAPGDVTQVDGTVQVRLPATRGYVARTVTMPRWVLPSLQHATEAARKQRHRLCVTVPPGDVEGDRQAVTAHLIRALAVVGADATPDALRLTAAHAALASGGPPAAAAALGTTSITAALRLLTPLRETTP